MASDAELLAAVREHGSPAAAGRAVGISRQAVAKRLTRLRAKDAAHGSNGSAPPPAAPQSTTPVATTAGSLERRRAFLRASEAKDYPVLRLTPERTLWAGDRAHARFALLATDEHLAQAEAYLARLPDPRTQAGRR